MSEPKMSHAVICPEKIVLMIVHHFENQVYQMLLGALRLENQQHQSNDKNRMHLRRLLECLLT